MTGDKTTTTTTTITTGFKQEQDKQTFIQQVDELRTQLRQIKSEIEQTAGLDEDEKEAIVAAVIQQVQALKAAKDEAAQVPAEQEPSPEKREAIKGPLDTVGDWLNSATRLVDKASGLADKVGPLVEKAVPLLLSARHLFGLP